MSHPLAQSLSEEQTGAAPIVWEAVPVIDELRDRAVEMYVALKPGYEPSKAVEEKVAKAIETEIGKDRPAEERLDRLGHAQDPLRKDHAPGHRGDLQLRRHRRRDHAGESRDR